MQSGFENSLVDALRDVVTGANWFCVGQVEKLKKNICSRFYSEDGDDIVLIYIKDKDRFYAMGAVCSHEGGPLEQGDIEDFDGRLKIICPWHSFDFDIETGYSSSGLQQDVYDVCVKDNSVYIYTANELSTKPFKRQNINQETSKANIDLPLTEEENKDSLTYLATKILNTACPVEKVKLTLETGERWKRGELTLGVSVPPDHPAREDNLKIVAPGKEKRRGKGRSLVSRITNLHAMANIEQWAIDLSWDIIARFSQFKPQGCEEGLPKEFCDEFIQVACDEAKHFNLLSERLKQLGSHFGALPIHNALWESAKTTKHSILARLAIVHMVHEARGLDVQPKTREKFSNNDDADSADILDIIFKDEITHVAAGLKWFTYICKRSNPPLDCIPTFHDLVRQYFGSYLKPPFNVEGRAVAGMTEEWYMPLVKPSK